MATQIPPTVAMELAEESDYGAGDEPEECGAELTSGGVCERPVDECPYPAHRE